MVLSVEGALEMLVMKLHMECEDDHDRIAVYKDILALAESVLDEYHVPECGARWDRQVCEFYRREYQHVLPLLKEKGYIGDKRRVIVRAMK